MQFYDKAQIGYTALHHANCHFVLHGSLQLLLHYCSILHLQLYRTIVLCKPPLHTNVCFILLSLQIYVFPQLTTQ